MCGRKVRRGMAPLAPLALLALLALLAVAAWAESPQQVNERFEKMRQVSPMVLRPFLMAMPKGGELHTHLTGAVYAEDYIEWAAANATLYWNRDSEKFVGPPANNSTIPAADLPRRPSDYAAAVNALSTRDWRPDPRLWGHDHFFAAFGKFGGAKSNTAALLARVADRAADQNLQYQEIMLSLYPRDLDAYATNSTHLNDTYQAMYDGLAASGLLRPAQVGEVRDWLDGVERAKKALVHDGRSVVTRYINQVRRTVPRNEVFTQLLFACELCRRDARVVALNLVAPEDNPTAVRDYADQMRMIQWLKGRDEYDSVNATLHAGELDLGLVAPEALRDHITQAVRVAGAQRIGHGAAVTYEADAYDLLQQMAGKEPIGAGRRKVLVEICLSSNDQILHLRGDRHPFKLYLQQGVPVSLNTDDEGIERVDLSNEFWRAAVEHGLSYLQLKNLARNSLEYCFLPGDSLWVDPVAFRPVPQCRDFKSRACGQFIQGSEKALEQYKLEVGFQRFEDRPPYLH